MSCVCVFFLKNDQLWWQKNKLIKKREHFFCQQIAVMRESEKKKKLEKNRGTRVTETERER